MLIQVMVCMPCPRGNVDRVPLFPFHTSSFNLGVAPTGKDVDNRLVVMPMEARSLAGGNFAQMHAYGIGRKVYDPQRMFSEFPKFI